MIGYLNNNFDKDWKLCTQEKFYELLGSEAVANAIAAVRSGDKNTKRRLPALVLCGVLNEAKYQAYLEQCKADGTKPKGSRREEFLLSNGLFMMDFDRTEGEAYALYEKFLRTMRENNIDTDGFLALAHRTPSGHGLRLVLRRREGSTIEADQHWISAMMNEPIDGVCKDLSRLSYAVTLNDLFFADNKMLFSEEVVAPLVGTQCIASEEPQPVDNHAEAARRVPTFPTTYKGVPYSEILHAIVEELGGEPEEGERNTKVLRMASSLRHICDNNPNWLMEIIPTYGLPEEEWKKTITNACKDGLKYGTTKVLQAALAKLRVVSSELRVDSALSTQNSELNAAPILPSKLPKLIELLTSKVPDYLKPAVAHAVFPALGAHLGGVYFRYNDNVKRQATFMNVLVAMQSCGKSAINKPLEMIMADIEERDMANRQREQEWKNQQQKKKSNERGKDRPTDLCIQVLSPNMTQAAFVQKQQDAGEEFLYTQTDEIDTFKQLQVGGATQIFRLAFDNGYYGQERVGSQSVTARVQIRWNWNTAGTVQRVRDFFRHAIADGTISRLNFCTIDTDFANEMPCYGEYDDQFRDELKAYIDRLNEAEGLITCEEATQLAKQIMEGMNEIGILTDDEAYRILSRRANVIGFLKAMTLFVAEGGWSPEIAEFVKWSVEYDMWCKMQVFGDMLQSELESENLPPQQRKNLLYMLPDTFTREDALNLRKRIGKNNNVNGMLRQWVHREYIVFDMEKNVYVKTDARYKRYERYSKK
ncbi:MAG: hypothetical protein J6A40_03740 [Bacteroides sp.]|nr:hypothetical protein [Bacteroides sp.]